jgi:hypothetical protein
VILRAPLSWCPMTTPAAWYPDPSDASQQRYWDGTQWTQHTRSATAGETQGSAPQETQANPQAQAEQAQVAQPAGAAAPTSAPGAAASVAGIQTDLLTDERYAEVGSNQRVIKQNSRLLKVVLGDDVLAKQGSMVAVQGRIDFDHEGAGLGKFMKKAVTGEGLPLMRCKGQGELFLADRGNQVHIIHLNGAGLTANGRNILAFKSRKSRVRVPSAPLEKPCAAVVRCLPIAPVTDRCLRRRRRHRPAPVRGWDRSAPDPGLC